MQTVIRESCGTYQGLKAHVLSDEKPCSECSRQEAIRRLEVEGIPFRLPSVYHEGQEVSRGEGERNRAVLAEAIRSVRGGRRG